MCQGGDFSNRNGTGGESIYGGKFGDESFRVRHTKAGLLSMANAGSNTNGSQFFITFAPAPHLDGKHVVFGEIVEGMKTLVLMEDVETDGKDKPVYGHEIRVDDCGVVDGSGSRYEEHGQNKKNRLKKSHALDKYEESLAAEKSQSKDVKKNDASDSEPDSDRHKKHTKKSKKSKSKKDRKKKASSKRRKRSYSSSSSSSDSDNSTNSEDSGTGSDSESSRSESRSYRKRKSKRKSDNCEDNKELLNKKQRNLEVEITKTQNENVPITKGEGEEYDHTDEKPPKVEEKKPTGVIGTDGILYKGRGIRKFTESRDRGRGGGRQSREFGGYRGRGGGFGWRQYRERSREGYNRDGNRRFREDSRDGGRKHEGITSRRSSDRGRYGRRELPSYRHSRVDRSASRSRSGSRKGRDKSQESSRSPPYNSRASIVEKKTGRETDRDEVFDNSRRRRSSRSPSDGSRRSDHSN